MKTIAFDPTKGILYGATGSDRFYPMDPATGAITDINTSTDRNIDAITFDSVGNLFGSRGNSNRFFDIDPSDGAIVDINTHTDRSIRAMVFVPEPTTLGLATIGAMSLIGFTVRRKKVSTCG